MASFFTGASLAILIAIGTWFGLNTLDISAPERIDQTSLKLGHPELEDRPPIGE